MYHENQDKNGHCSNQAQHHSKQVAIALLSKPYVSVYPKRWPTVHATPIEVKYVKSPFLYQIVRRGGSEQPRQAAAVAEGSYREEKPKRKGLFGALFGK